MERKRREERGKQIGIGRREGKGPEVGWEAVLPERKEKIKRGKEWKTEALTGRSGCGGGKRRVDEWKLERKEVRVKGDEKTR